MGQAAEREIARAEREALAPWKAAVARARVIGKRLAGATAADAKISD